MFGQDVTVPRSGQVDEEPVIPEARYADLLTGTDKPSILMTDGYKFAMGQAGFPLRQETFYLAFRKGGPHYVPFDFGQVVHALRPRIPVDVEESEFLENSGYGLTPAMLAAVVAGEIETWAPPVGSWVGDGEPLTTVTGPSFLVSWLEPLVVMFRYAVQVATAAMTGTTIFHCTCLTEADIVRLVLGTVGVRGCTVTSDKYGYVDAVRANVIAVEKALNGDLSRAFEVGMRAATCMEMHDLVMEVCAGEDAGADLWHTSNVFLASRHTMIPVGTVGHEHQQRWLSDGAGFRALRDMRPGRPTYLFDTYDTWKSGIPAAIAVMREGNRTCAVRFDSGDQTAQFMKFLEAEREHGIRPYYIFEDGYTATRTAENETLRVRHDITPERFSYGYGGFLVNPEGAVQFRRDDVQAVYKLSKRGDVPVMKTCGSKSSLPGVPMVLVDDYGKHVVAQAGETIPGYHPLTVDDPKPGPIVPDMTISSVQDIAAAIRMSAPVGKSPETTRLIRECARMSDYGAHFGSQVRNDSEENP